MKLGPLTKTPFYVLDSRSDREAELAAYIHRQHRRGRRLETVLRDPYVQRRGRQGVLRSVLRQPELFRALRHDIVEAIFRDRATLAAGRAETR